ncbi:TPA: hypothetical protein I3803_004828, partial [Enterobacter cloacae]|nr:hypothetical protein [Enterobacter cloacae]
KTPAGTHDVTLTATQSQLAASVVAANSVLTVSPASIAADDSTEATVTFTAKDAQNHPVTGMSEATVGFAATTALTAGEYSLSGFSEANGVYTVKVKGSAPGTLSLNAASAFGLTAQNLSLHAILKDISVNGHAFSKDAGFPTTGFIGARFTINLSNNANASDYDWTTSGSYNFISVNNGEVRFVRQPTTGGSVTITATPKRSSNPGTEQITYTFKVGSWFRMYDKNQLLISDAINSCSAHGMNIPAMAQLSKDTDVRGVGSLVSEWGRLDNYTNSDFSGIGSSHSLMWASDKTNNSDNYYVNMINGYQFFVYGGNITTKNYAVCSTNI